MTSKMESYIADELQARGISLLIPGDRICSKFHNNLRLLRQSFLDTEKCLVPLTSATFWDVTPKFRFDLLGEDIVKIGNQLAYAIGLAGIHLPTQQRLCSPQPLFWYNIDFGIRLASSGWDRLSLLLDLAFRLDLREKCNFSNALCKMKKMQPLLDKDKHFRSLWGFRANAFEELEAKNSKGARHETTHLLTPSTRYFFACLEKQIGKVEGIPEDVEPEGRLKMLARHHDHYIRGIDDVIGVTETHWRGCRQENDCV